MKKLIAIIISASVLFALCACSNTNNSPESETKSTVASSTEAPSNSSENITSANSQQGNNETPTVAIDNNVEYVDEITVNDSKAPTKTTKPSSNNSTTQASNNSTTQSQNNSTTNSSNETTTKSNNDIIVNPDGSIETPRIPLN